MVTSKADLTAEQRGQLYGYFCELRDFFQVTGTKHDRSNSARAQKARSKLLKLYASQFFELSTDVHDELQRRIDENQAQPDHLLPKDTFHVKRNQARQKLANLSQSRFNDLVDDILYEIKRRNYHEKPEHKGADTSEKFSEETPTSSSHFEGIFSGDETGNHTKDTGETSDTSQADMHSQKNSHNLAPEIILGDANESPSKITPNASVQASQVIPKKASIEWSSDEEDEDSSHKPKLLSAGEQDSPMNSSQTGETTMQSPLFSSKDADRLQFSETENGLDKDASPSRDENYTFSEDFSSQSPLFSSNKKTKRFSELEDDLNHNGQSIDGNGNVFLGQSPPGSPLFLPHHTEADDDHEQLALSEVMGDKEEEAAPSQGHTSGKDLQGTVTDVSLPVSRGMSENRSVAPQIHSTNGDGVYSTSTANHNGRVSNESGTSINAYAGNRGSIKRASLEHENSKREIEVLMAEGTKMDMRITELEKSNSILSSAKSELERRLQDHQAENSELESRLEKFSREAEVAKAEISRLTQQEVKEDNSLGRSIDQSHQEEFARLTKQVNSLSIENEELKQKNAELEFKMKILNSSSRKDEKSVSPSTRQNVAGSDYLKEKDFLSDPDALKKYASPDGLLPLDLIVSFNKQIETIFNHLHNNQKLSEFGDLLFGDISRISDLVHMTIKLVDVSDHQDQVILLKASLSHAITSVRYFATYHDILPLVTVESAISDISFAVCGLLDIVKIIDAPQTIIGEQRASQISPQTPIMKNMKSSSSLAGEETGSGFKDPREINKYTADKPNSSMSPVKPLKITQKVVKNSPPTKPTISARKPSSTLFTSMLSPSLSNNSSPRNSQFSNLRFASGAKSEEDVRVDKGSEPKNNSRTDKENCAHLPESRSLVEEKVDSSQQESKKTDDDSGLNPQARVFVNDKENPSHSKEESAKSEKRVSSCGSDFGTKGSVLGKTNRGPDFSFGAISGDDTTDDQYNHKSDASNTTSDEDLTYQTLKQTMRKNHEAAGEKKVEVSDSSKDSTEKINVPKLRSTLDSSSKNGNNEDETSSKTIQGAVHAKGVLDEHPKIIKQVITTEMDGPPDETDVDIETSPFRFDDAMALEKSINHNSPVKNLQLDFSKNFEGKKEESAVVPTGNQNLGFKDSANEACNTNNAVLPETGNRFNDLRGDLSSDESPKQEQVRSSLNNVKKEDRVDAQTANLSHSTGQSPSPPNPIIKVSNFESEEAPAAKPFVKQEESDNVRSIPVVKRAKSTSSNKQKSSARFSNASLADKEYEDEGDFDIDAFDIENPDNTLSELLLYLEHQTIEVISTIQSLLTSIKQPQASTGELRKGSGAITQVIAQMVEATSVSMAQSRNAPLKEHGNWVVQSLEDCQRRMTTLCRLRRDGTVEVNEGDSDYADKHFKQRLAGIAFDVAKCTKELVKTVEEASLKEEIEYLNSKISP
ncbi:LAQU0S02e07910g1_1 [Lachancea quebecensis]|uniref:LAQU0S02e07910g1_1 n=1 Tax=Lachancea quebecensis TaxID=1654605 RepID=A0A0P1KQV9_9SACH|nr:LAQU0S02e07910g1_1 [Lachancea quebecensis]